MCVCVCVCVFSLSISETHLSASWEIDASQLDFYRYLRVMIGEGGNSDGTRYVYRRRRLSAYIGIEATSVSC